MSRALVHEEDEHTIPKEEKVGLYDMIEVLAEPSLDLRPVLGVRELHATPALAGDHGRDYLHDIFRHPDSLEHVDHARRGRVPEAFVES